MVVRKQINFIYGTVASCCLSIIICGVSLGTDNWYTGVARSPESEVVVTISDINYGLFKGSKTKLSKYVDLKVICADGVCMYSCGLNADLRREDHRRLLATGEANDNICDEPGTRAGFADKLRADGNDQGDRFFKFGFWLVTIVALAMGITFSAVGGFLALYNTFRTPIQPILSIFGLYVWNGIAAVSIFLALVLWGSAFASSLKKNAAVSDTISGSKSSEGEGSLGYSYWILILAMLLNLVNIGLIRFRSWKIAKLEEKITQVIDEKMTNGDILLF